MSVTKDTPEVRRIADQILESGKDILLLGFGGSVAYGTDTPASDIDIRGFYRNPLDELIGTKKDSEQFVVPGSDTMVYSFKKIMGLLASCNPNVIELLGLKPGHYIYSTPEAELLLANKDAFLSKRAIYTFGQYAKSQLNRLVNKAGRGKSETLQNEQRSLSKSMAAMENRYHNDNIRVSFDARNGVILTDFHAEAIPMEQLIGIMNELGSVHRDYAKSQRNDKAIEHSKLGKHQMHLLRLFMMGLDILEKHEIVTYRADEHDLLMAIRRGEYLEDDKMTPTREFEVLLADYTARFERAAESSSLPDQPDYERINRLAIEINSMRENRS